MLTLSLPRLGSYIYKQLQLQKNGNIRDNQSDTFLEAKHLMHFEFFAWFLTLLLLSIGMRVSIFVLAR